MPADPALTQLLEMGIPGGRARAALRRAKGDVMAAAERVFGGEFDDIPSDDEGLDEVVNSGVTGLQTPEERSREATIDVPIAERVARVSVTDDEDDDMEGDEVDIGDDYGDLDDEDDFVPRHRSDPYAGVFFSKDRVEKVIETVDKPEYAVISLPRAAVSGEESANVRLLSTGEWMSGCPEGNEQSFLFQLYNYLSQGDMPCSSGCGHGFTRRKQDFFAVLPDFPSYTSYLASVIRPVCPECSHVTCLACGDPVDRAPPQLNFSFGDDGGKAKDRGNASTSSLEVPELLHCVNLQGVIIGVGLYMIEQAFGQGRVDYPPTPKTPPAKKRKTGTFNLKESPASKHVAAGAKTGVSSMTSGLKSFFDPDDDEDDFPGMGAGHGNGVGYAGRTVEDRSGQLKAQAAQMARDGETAELLSQVQVYLPHPNRASGTRTSDHLVHPTALAHLRRRSAFVNDLLRNDSLLDMSNRAGIYRALFDWLEIVSSNEALAGMLAMPQMRPAKYEPLPDQPGSMSVTYEGSPSPRELLESVVIQAQAALKGLEGTATKDEPAKDSGDESMLRMSAAEVAKEKADKLKGRRHDANARLEDFCDRIIASAEAIDKSLAETKGAEFVQRMRESLPKIPQGGGATEERDLKGETDEGLIKIYEDWATRARFQYADLSIEDDGVLSYRHAYSAQILALGNCDAPKRSLAIAKELAILTTNLPVAWHSTIFLRVDESRVDCIKAMIIGPEGTPYENGCFLFDIHLPLEYNHACPQVKSMTTNGGRYRYNPNLYPDGKVCLSLLGTWSGPGWISGQSTLLQVLISIQSLILCEEPYLNEPGWSKDVGTPQSKAYSANVRRMVLIDAMGNNIKNPPHPFESEIRTHFRLKAKSIRKQLEAWKKLDDGRDIDSYAHSGFGSSSAAALHTGDKARKAFDKAADEVRRLLDDLEGGKDVVSGNGGSVAALKTKEVEAQSFLGRMEKVKDREMEKVGKMQKKTGEGSGSGSGSSGVKDKVGKLLGKK
ncbi:hypothetical protein JCM24511_07189 [Saitozyma sp. JCM 24511]|nr:hypothetical protein JCM24511_07189 [Saitozyma sp. JCM 24511]